MPSNKIVLFLDRHLKKMFNYSVYSHANNHRYPLEETVHKESRYCSKEICINIFFRVSIPKRNALLSPTNYRQHIPKACYSDSCFYVSKEKFILKFYRQK